MGKRVKIEEMEAGVVEMQRMDVGHIMKVVVKGEYLRGDYYMKEYEKVNDDEVEIIDQGWRS